MIEPKEILKNIQRTPDSNEIRIGKVMRLDHNERTTPLSKDIVEAVFKHIDPEEVVAYPELGPLYNKLAQFLGVPRSQLLLCCGSDTGIKNIFEVYVDKGDEVIILTPSFEMFYVYCDMFGADKILVEYDKDFSLPIDRITDKINPKTKLVILANPNHTGTVIEEKDLCTVIECAARTNTIVLVDEAYHFFYQGTMISYLKKYDNLIIVRTFSKSFGIAALRVGYIASQSQNIQNLRKVKSTHEITSVSAKFAEYLIGHPEINATHVREVEEGKNYIQTQCRQLGMEMLPSVTNFVFIRLPASVDAQIIVDQLKERNIYIKGPFRDGPVEGLIRITLGPAQQMQKFIDVFKKILEDVQIGTR